MATSMHSSVHAKAIADAIRVLEMGGTVDSKPTPICLYCSKPESEEKKLVRCSSCKVALYCDQKCGTGDWKMIHRYVCSYFKMSTLKVPEVQAIAKQFPWATQQDDGNFNFEIFRAWRGLLGCGREYGWWSEQPCCADKSWYHWGFQLLEEDHLQEDVGWKLPREQIPWLDFTAGSLTPPKSSPPAEHSWSQYYKWRGLPIESPAVLLLHWPLAVYRLLYLLGLTVPCPTQRRHLTVHLIGLEKELDLLPIFGELALLLPNTDLDLVLFGPGVANIVGQAKSKPSSLASRPFVYTYKAPKISGAGAIRIELARCGPRYNANLSVLRKERPDALLALNAGLSAYTEWRPVIYTSRALAIPFAVTDYIEVSLKSDMHVLPGSLRKGALFPEVKHTDSEDQRIKDIPNAVFVVDINPFMCLGPRAHEQHAGPSAVNGFTLVVTPGPGQQ